MSKIVFVDEVSQEIYWIVKTDDIEGEVKRFEKEWNVRCWLEYDPEKDEYVAFFGGVEGDGG